jgi:hypothetical protein
LKNFNYFEEIMHFSRFLDFSAAKLMNQPIQISIGTSIVKATISLFCNIKHRTLSN